MKLVIYDFKNDKDYYIKNVEDDKLDYYLNCYIRDKEIQKIKEQRKNKRKCFFSYAIYFLLYGIVFSFIRKGQLEEERLKNYNLFDTNEVTISDDKVQDICKSIEEELGVTISKENKDAYLLLDAVMQNKNLTEKEKEFCYKYIDVFMDNPYLNKEKAYQSLLNLEITYTDRPSNVRESIDGSYYYPTFDVEVYEDDIYKSVLSHEVIHCIYSNEITYNLPRFFKEGMTELLANEYFSENPFCEVRYYPFEIAAVKMLCEVTSADTVLKAFSYGDMSYITKELGQYIGGEKEAEEVIGILSTILDERNDNKELSYTVQEVYDKCLFKFDYCMEYKYENGLIDTLPYYCNRNLFYNVCEYYSYDYYISDLGFYGYICKPYFSNKLKNDYNERDCNQIKLTEEEIKFLRK